MRSRNGFTLIELMIVVVIIGILAAVAIPKFNQVSRNAKQAEAPPVLKQLHTLQERHQQMKGVYATSVEQLEGSAVNFEDGEYFSFSMTAADEASYTACATPLDESHGLQSMSISQTGVVVEGGC